MYRKLLPVFLALILAACQGAPLFNFGPTPTPFPEEFTGTAQVGGHELLISCRGSGEATIILERGVYDKGFDLVDNIRLGKITRTCFYLRSGLATGDVYSEPRTNLDQVKDLHSLLEQTGVPGPYILVGYELAGHNLILYADQYPQDVAGLVFIEPSYPTFYATALKKLGPATAETTEERKALITEISDYLAQKIYPWNEHPEYIDRFASEAQVLKVASLIDVPLAIIQSEIYYQGISDIDSRQILTNAVNESHKDLCLLSSNCQTVLVPGTDLLDVLYDSAFEKAVQEMYEAVKKP